MTDRPTIVVAYDFSVHADAALFTAADFARKLSGNIVLLHVVQDPALVYGVAPFGAGMAPVLSPHVDRGIEDRLAEVADTCDVPGVEIKGATLRGHAIDLAITEYCDEVGADLLVMGTHGRTGMAHVFIGSVAERTLRRAPCPVLTVRADEDD